MENCKDVRDLDKAVLGHEVKGWPMWSDVTEKPLKTQIVEKQITF